ncbi:MAG: DUF4070 domain-containing protein, partial [Leptolyngbyaceae cyanobacterium CAN_BIN12]|nr:DUF4070 domain-containing protein [Leptolyngbyaceae cyanobacterium CAN_BIN12]
YEPKKFLSRTYRHFMLLSEANYPDKGKVAQKKIDRVALRAIAIIFWRQGFVRDTRWMFWRYLWGMYRHNRGGLSSYLSTCAQIEHFVEYREIVRREIEAQVVEFLQNDAAVKVEEKVAHPVA